MSLRRRKPAPVPPLTVGVHREVRFEEIDPLNIMWHGRYASWLEDGREALGKAHGIHYLDFYRHGIAIPLKEFHLNFCQPLRYGHSYEIHTSLLWDDAALLDMEYRICDAQGQVMTKAHTTQLMVTLEGELLLEQPLFFRQFRQDWKRRHEEGALP